MAHIIQREKENYSVCCGAKFVSAKSPNGDYLTQIANYQRMKLSHVRLMQQLLVSINVLDPKVIGTFDAPGLKPFAQYCMGGGSMYDGAFEWRSMSIQEELGRDRPDDCELATLLLEEIHASLRAVCSKK